MAAVDITEFIGLVRKMRRAQQDYFRTGDRRTLQHARDLERRVDVLLEAQAPTTRSLFPPTTEST